MNTSQQLAKNFHDVYHGGNWTAVDFKKVLEDISWQQAVTPVHSFNTIAALVYHMNYYVKAVIGVLEGAPLSASDKFSFDYPPVKSQEDWENLLHTVEQDALVFEDLVAKLPEEKLQEDFWNNQYGNYFRNIMGVTEHCHYHLGQIVLIKKLLVK